MLEKFLLVIFSCIFICTNIALIYWDIQRNIIKNIYIWILFLWWICIQIYFTALGDNHFLDVVTFTTLFFLLSFILFYFRIWWAGDAKYFFVLSLWFTHTSILTYLGNIVIVTLIFLWLFFLKNLFQKNENWVWLWSLITGDFRRMVEDIKRKVTRSKSHSFLYIINILNTFLLLFLLIRLMRNLLLDHSYMFQAQIEKMSFDIEYTILISIIILFIVLRRFLSYLQNQISRKFSLSKVEVETLFNLGFLWIVLYVSLKEYSKNPTDFLSQMYSILTISFIILLTIKIGIFIYKKCFIDMEKSIIPIEDLQHTDFIDKNYFQQRITPLKITTSSWEPLSPKNMTLEDVAKVQEELIRLFPKEPFITIYNTFPFSPVIFFAFVMSFVLGYSPLFAIFSHIKDMIF